MKAAIWCTWANNCVLKNLGPSQRKYDRAKFSDCIHTKIVDFFAFSKCFCCVSAKSVCELKKGKRRKKKENNPPNRNTLCLKVQMRTFYETELCRIREAVLLQMQTIQVLMPLWKTAGTTLWIYSSAYIYLYMNMFK